MDASSESSTGACNHSVIDMPTGVSRALYRGGENGSNLIGELLVNALLVNAGLNSVG
eukprot:SAG31_NODE_819_length_11811_cov_3.315488_7_plen_57_part_00